jgi:hypothetical protein
MADVISLPIWLFGNTSAISGQLLHGGDHFELTGTGNGAMIGRR